MLRFYKIFLLFLMMFLAFNFSNLVFADAPNNLGAQQNRVIIDETAEAQSQGGSTNAATLIFSVIGSLGLFGIAFLAVRSFYKNSKKEDQ